MVKGSYVNIPCEWINVCLFVYLALHSSGIAPLVKRSEVVFMLFYSLDSLFRDHRFLKCLRTHIKELALNFRTSSGSARDDRCCEFEILKGGHVEAGEPGVRQDLSGISTSTQPLFLRLFEEL